MVWTAFAPEWVEHKREAKRGEFKNGGTALEINEFVVSGGWVDERGWWGGVKKRMHKGCLKHK